MRGFEVDMPKSEETRFEELSDPSNFAGLDEKDLTNVASWVKKMGSAIGKDMGKDFKQAVKKEVAGESAEPNEYF